MPRPAKPRTRLILAAIVLVVVMVAPPAAADLLFEDRGLANGGETVFVGHPASFTGVCPYVDVGPGWPDGGCMERYEFNVPSTSDESNGVEIVVEYNTAVIRETLVCVKDNDLDLYLYDVDGNIEAKRTGCDVGVLGMQLSDLPSGNYVAEVRGNWGAVVEYHAKGTLTHSVR